MEQPAGWGAPSAFFELAAPEARELATSKLRGQAVLGSALPGGRRAADACASILEVCPLPLSASAPTRCWLHIHDF